MTRLLVLFLLVLFLLSSLPLAAQTSPATIKYDEARLHELKPHRRSIPVDGITGAFNQLHLTLTISPAGDVTHAEASGDALSEKYWPSIEGEVSQWRFTPFEQSGHPIAAEIEEYVDLVPPERLPKTHVAPPTIRPESKIAISLTRSGCFGSCPAYTVTLDQSRILFEGRGSTVATGKHTALLDPDAIRKLARQFISDDFYSMDPDYSASITDSPSYQLTLSIDGQAKEVLDYMGTLVGMPSVITDLEDQVDILAQTDRWIVGADGLVPALLDEKYDFQTFQAQTMLKQAARNGQPGTVRELLEAGVPLKPMPTPKPKTEYEAIPYEHVGWLNAAANSSEVLHLLIAHKASKDDQSDKDLALATAARSGNLGSVRALIAYGANPNADLTKLMVTTVGAGMTMEGPGAGSILIDAASSGNPAVLREILTFHPNLELHDHEGQTALYAAGDSTPENDDDAVECVRLLIAAGANVNARDGEGNTPLHEIFDDDAVEELLKHGANVNARNNDGETPIFTNVSDSAVLLMIAHGADLTLRNHKGQTAYEASRSHGPQRQRLLLQATQHPTATH
jgi:ankyrin repeat protein